MAGDVVRPAFRSHSSRRECLTVDGSIQDIVWHVSSGWTDGDDSWLWEHHREGDTRAWRLLLLDLGPAVYLVLFDSPDSQVPVACRRYPGY